MCKAKVSRGQSVQLAGNDSSKRKKEEEEKDAIDVNWNAQLYIRQSRLWTISRKGIGSTPRYGSIIIIIINHRKLSWFEKMNRACICVLYDRGTALTDGLTDGRMEGGWEYNTMLMATTTDASDGTYVWNAVRAGRSSAAYSYFLISSSRANGCHSKRLWRGLTVWCNRTAEQRSKSK